MELLCRLAELWSWLPAFRAVAETQHLPSAAKELATSASALSRAVGLLEANLGTRLFRRVGRRLELNEAGERFLASIRDAMRLAHEAVLTVRSEQLVGTVNIASGGMMTSAYVVPALAALRRQHARLFPKVDSDTGTVVPRLLKGTLDVAFLSEPVQHSNLTTRHLGAASAGVYCGRGHPLHSRRRVGMDEVLEHEFVAPPAAADGQIHDGWPPHLQRRAAMCVDQMRIGCEVCARGDLLAVLPDAVAAGWGSALRRLSVPAIPDTQLFAVLRPHLGFRSRADAVAEAVEREIEVGGRTNARRRALAPGPGSRTRPVTPTAASGTATGSAPPTCV